MRVFFKHPYALVLLWLVLCPMQVTQGNPFAPLQVAAESKTPQAATRPIAYELQSRFEAEVTGIIWHTERPVAIMNERPVTVGFRLGTAQIAAIRPNAVDITDDGEQVFSLFLNGGLSSNAPFTRVDPNYEHLHLYVDNAACRTVLEALAYQAEKNIVFVGEITTLIRLNMQDVTWQEAMHAVLQSGDCSMTQKGQTLTIQERGETLVTQTFPINHGKSKDLEVSVNKLLSEDGKIGVDERLNALVVTDTSEHLERIQEAIQRLDKKAPQVLIEVLIVNVILNDERKMGVDWQIIGSKGAGESIILTQELNATTLTNPYGAMSFNTVSGDWSFTSLLDFVQTHENVTVLASPKVLVLNNHTATFDAVEEIPYQQLSETSGGGFIGTTAFKDAGVKLQVTPQISDDGYIAMHIEPEQSARVGTFSVDGTDTPVIETRKTTTDLRVKDGQTVIIGGLRKKEPFRKESRIPLLGDIPLLGRLFRQVHVKEADSELGIFITPRVYRDDVPNGGDMELVESKDDLAALWDTKVMNEKDRRSKE
ncbi:type II secretion system protein GspD [Planctomycetota bacterium]